MRPPTDQAVEAMPRRLFHYNGGFFAPRLRRILALSGHELHLGLPKPHDGVVVWGRSPHATRGEAVAAKRGVALVRVEDAFLRSVQPGRVARSQPLGLLLDPSGVHFDSASPSRIEQILAQHPLDQSDLLQRSRDGIARIKAFELSKYNNFDPAHPLPDPGYVLVVDQTLGDASIAYGRANAAVFREMLACAQIENPGARILIKSHPETVLGLRQGHYSIADCNARVQILSDPVSPWRLLEGAIAVYTVSSQLGFEAILAGHRPRVFGQPFYSGWGLSADENPVPRRQRRLTRAQLFAVSHILAPIWYDPCRDRLCSFEEALDQLEAEVRAFRDDRAGHVAVGMRLWKRGPLQRFFGGPRKVKFVNSPEKALKLARAEHRRVMVWASREGPEVQATDLPVVRVEDGFLRSQGLGAALVAPLSLVLDRQGIYTDPSRPSDLEQLISGPVPAGGLRRAEHLVARIIAARLSKYNLPAAGLPDIPQGHRILVPGQVEDDASIRFGAKAVTTNLDLLRRVRAENPDAVIVYKPHPDVEAGLRPGAIASDVARQHADVLAPQTEPISLIEACDAVWTITSLLGFEALLRGKPVTCLGVPFYAGWGLTRDLGATPTRRRARPELHALAYATLIAYPRYHDPLSRLACPPEVIAQRLAEGRITQSGLGLRSLAKIQGIFASFAFIWR